MKPPLPRDRIQLALESLKDFQRDTAEYVFSRLYGGEDPCRRILVSDEVGLGKTMVAKGVIARALEHLWERVPRIDVVYICSNADIARQNVDRLNVLDSKDGFRTADRLTLLAQEISDLKDVNFIALTPGTSFDLGSSLGIARERAYLYWILKEAWGFGSGVAPYNVMRGNVDLDRFRARVQQDRPDGDQLTKLAGRFLQGLGDKGAALREEFDALCHSIGRRHGALAREERGERNRFIAKARAALARSCIEELNPDLVILDEFQRFKDLLSSDDDAAELARSLFEYQDEHSQAKVMLLSATPYRMLTLSSQGDEDDHYADFLKTIEFLVPDAGRFAGYRSAVEAFRSEFVRLRTTGDIEALLRAKDALAELLRKVVVRTERLAHTPDRSGMLTERPLAEVLKPADLGSYVSAHGIAAVVQDRDTIEYWKSAPYYLSFMEGYQIRDKLRSAMADDELARKIAAGIARAQPALLPMRALAGEQPIEPANARLRGFLEVYEAEGATDLLWIPPSLQYYEPGEPFSKASARGITKRLLFSSWRMVPKSLASIISYCVANRALLRYEAARGKQGTGQSRWPSPLLRVQREGGGMRGMPMMTLIYPSAYLARLCDPLQIGIALRGQLGRLATLEEVRAEAERRIKQKLHLFVRWSTESAATDEKWYWAGGVLFDVATNEIVTKHFLMDDDNRAAIQGKDGHDEASEPEDQALYELFALVRASSLGALPADLAEVLADIALGSPAICALRALRRDKWDLPEWEEIESLVEAGRIGWAFRNLFNLPESIVTIRGQQDAEPYWRRVLRYSAAGGLQSVLDEYCHVLVDSEALWQKSREERYASLGDAIVKALEIRPAAIGADEFTANADEGTFAMQTYRLKGRFAMPLVETKAQDTGVDDKPETQASRTAKVRAAFNSPFWPFVLISTSIGQEGLDFHRYCHAVVHWNLPSNPVDLEQREGRVHRFKGHAVRKNLAAAYGLPNSEGDVGDPWQSVFENAVADRPGGANELLPYWIYTKPGGAVIERHVPAMPLSREAERIIDLRKTLAVYRMVFGQPRQEDLIEYLVTRFDDAERKRLIEGLRIDLSPPKARGEPPRT